MVELIRDYWWLSLPLLGIVILAVQQFTAYRRRVALVELAMFYQQKGMTLSPEMKRALEQVGN